MLLALLAAIGLTIGMVVGMVSDRDRLIYTVRLMNPWRNEHYRTGEGHDHFGEVAGQAMANWFGLLAFVTFPFWIDDIFKVELPGLRADIAVSCAIGGVLAGAYLVARYRLAVSKPSDSRGTSREDVLDYYGFSDPLDARLNAKSRRARTHPPSGD